MLRNHINFNSSDIIIKESVGDRNAYLDQFPIFQKISLF